MHFAHRLLYLFASSEIQLGLPARLFRRHASSEVGFKLFGDVECDFAVARFVATAEQAFRPTHVRLLFGRPQNQRHGLRQPVPGLFF